MSLCWLSQCNRIMSQSVHVIKCLNEFPQGHPKMFERTLDIISLFVWAISNNINLFPSFFVLFPMNRLGK